MNVGVENDELRQSTRNTKIDRFSNLPDNVLLHIMNFMDTKDAVRTCGCTIANISLISHFIMITDELSNMYSRTPQPPCFVRLELLKVDKQVPIKISDKEVTRVVDFLLQNSPSAKVDIS
uniref:F-box domain-containing protein n=1 Tax=Cajanus cajan TaxID=3821 RepID=A0A151UIE9_CAJCA